MKSAFSSPRRVLLLTLAILSCLPEVFAQGHEPIDRPQSGIMVTGECLTKVTQDTGSVTIGSSALSPSSKECSEKVIKAHEAIKKSVRDLNLPELAVETAEYSVQQECSYHEGKRHCQGFRAHLATRFETSDIARLGDVIAVSSSAGAEDVSGLTIFASPSKIKMARESCLETAMKDALAKAQKLANGAGIKLGKLLSVVEGGGHDLGEPMPMARRVGAAMMAEASAAAPSVDSKPLDVRVEVVARYAVE